MVVVIIRECDEERYSNQLRFHSVRKVQKEKYITLPTFNMFILKIFLPMAYKIPKFLSIQIINLQKYNLYHFPICSIIKTAFYCLEN